LEVVRNLVAENQWPLFGATAIGVIAFAAIGLSEDRTGEYCNSLFWVILISLSLSWVSSITATPLLSYLFFKPVAPSPLPLSPSEGERGRGEGGSSGNNDPYNSLPFRIYRTLLTLALRFRWAVVVLAIVSFIASLYGFSRVDRSFFPPATRPQFMVDVFLPAGTHIRGTETFACGVPRDIPARPVLTHVPSLLRIRLQP